MSQQQIQLEFPELDKAIKNETCPDIRRRLNEIKYLGQRIKELEHEIEVLKRFIGGYDDESIEQ